MWQVSVSFVSRVSDLRTPVLNSHLDSKPDTCLSSTGFRDHETTDKKFAFLSRDLASNVFSSEKQSVQVP